MLCRNLYFSAKDCFCFTFPFDLASFSFLSIYYFLVEHMITFWIFVCWVFFYFCSPSSFFFLPFSLVLEIPWAHKFVTQNFCLVQYNRQKYLSNENSSGAKIFQVTSRMQIQCCLTFTCDRMLSLKLHCFHSLHCFFILLGLVSEVLGFCEADWRDH